MNILFLFLLLILIFIIIFLVLKPIRYADFNSFRLPKYVSNPIRGDGFGAQFQTIIASICMAPYENKIFVYYPFKRIEHNYNNDPKYTEKLESFINVINHYPPYMNNAEHYDLYDLIRRFDSNLEYFITKSKQFLKYKKIFFSNKQKPYFYNNNKINIAIHIRKINKQDLKLDKERQTDDNYYINKIAMIRKKFSNAKLSFHIFSQGDLNYFKNIFRGKDIKFHINTDICETFSGLIFADKLILSKSSFSYSAALLSSGEIYYQKFWHPPLKNWIL